MSELRNYRLLPNQDDCPATINDPKNTGRFLFSEQQKNQVIDVQKYREPKHTTNGTIFYDEYTMTDGVKHRVSEGIPHQQLSSIPIDSTTAWFTQPEGHNAQTDGALMGIGFRTRRVGPERASEEVRSSQHLNIDFHYLAHNILGILNVADNNRSYGLAKGNSLYTGESRGAMIEPALQLLSGHYGRSIAHSDTIDPCCPEKTNFTDIAKLSKVALSEAEAIGRSVLHILKSPQRLNYVRTVDITPECFLPAIRAARYLLNGQAGDIARQRSIVNKPMNITFMRRSYAAEQDIFENIYRDQPNVNIQVRKGSHMDIPRTLNGVVRRHKRIMKQLQENGDDPTNLDLDKVYDRAKPKRKLWLIT